MGKESSPLLGDSKSSKKRKKKIKNKHKVQKKKSTPQNVEQVFIYNNLFVLRKKYKHES